MSAINERIKNYRTAQSLSQKEVGDACGVSRVAVTKWENGATENMKLSNLVGMVKLFKVSFDELIVGKAEPAESAHTAQEQAPAFTYRLQGIIERLAQLPENSLILDAIDLMLSAPGSAPIARKAKRDNTAKSRSTLASRLGKYDESKTSVK